MEKIFNTIKTFIKEVLPLYTAKYEDEEVTLPVISDDAIVFGSVDLSRYTQDVICSVIPESQDNTGATIDGISIESKFTLTILCQGAVYETLVKRVCRYSEALNEALLYYPTLNNDGQIDDTELGTRTFYTDAGTLDKQLSGVEMTLTVTTDKKIEE